MTKHPHAADEPEADDFATQKAKLVAACTAKFPPPKAVQSGGATITHDASVVTPELIDKCCDECCKAVAAAAPGAKIDWMAIFMQLLPILLALFQNPPTPTPKPEPGL